MRRLARGLLWSLALLLVATLAVAFAYRQLTLPKIDGTLALAGLTAPVDVVRDAEGIPHVYAANEDDAWFTLGYLHAQDRLWQMEMNRRTAAGRLSEILGAGALDTDRFLRTLGIRRNAEAIAQQLDAPTRRALDRYAAGVNANLDQRRGAPRALLGAEFALTGAPFPEPWTPADSVGWSTMMAWDLSTNWSSEIARMRLSQRLTKRQIDELMPPYPGNPARRRRRPRARADRRRAARHRRLPGALPVAEDRRAGAVRRGGRADGAGAVAARRRASARTTGSSPGARTASGQAAARERPSPRDEHAVDLVPRAPVGAGSRRDRCDAPGAAVRGARTQRDDRLGRDEHGARYAGPVRRAAARGRRQDRGAHARRMAAAGDAQRDRSASRTAPT